MRKVMVLNVSEENPKNATVCACPGCAATFYINESAGWGKEKCPHCGEELDWTNAGWNDIKTTACGGDSRPV